MKCRPDDAKVRYMECNNLGKSDCFRCVVLLCCLFDLACFFLPSASLINVYIAPGIYIMLSINY